MASVRRTSVAGTWYPDNPTRLVSRRRWLSCRAADRRPGWPAPRDHCAARRADVLGAGCRLRLQRGAPSSAFGTSCWSAPRTSSRSRASRSGRDGDWETPLGPVNVDRDLAPRAWPAGSSQIVDLPAAHGREHSLEMQLPFLAHLLPGVPIVPLVMGQQTARRRSRWARPSRGRSRRMHRTRCSWPAATSRTTRMPRRPRRSTGWSFEHVERLDAERPDGRARARAAHACGGGPMVAVLHAARRLGATPRAAATVCGLRRRVR